MVIDNEQHTVFVYGSLKRGGQLNHLMNNANYIGEFNTDNKWGLINLGAFPGMVYGDLSVEGEAYIISNNTLEDLDIVEGSMYTRRRIPLFNKDGSEAMNAWTYIYNTNPLASASRPKTASWSV